MEVRNRPFILFSLTFALLSSWAQAATYYVDGNSSAASDSNPGTQTQPWKTIQKGASTAIGGDTVYVKAGTYSGDVAPANSGNASAGPITFSAFPGQEQQVILSSASFQVKKSYITVHAFRIEHAPKQGILIQGPGISNVVIDGNYTFDTGTSGIAAWGVPYGTDPNTCGFQCITNLLIENNTVDQANNPNLPGQGFNENLDVANGVDTFEVRNNTIKNGNVTANGGEGLDCKEGVSNGKIWGNQIFNEPKYGIYLDAGASPSTIYSKPAATVNLQVYNNVIHDVYSAHGVGITSEGLGTIDGINFFNNVIYHNGSDGVLVYHFPGATGSQNNINLFNNTVYNNAYVTASYGGIAIDDDIATNVTVRNNIATGNGGFQIKTQNASALIDHNLTTGDPLYVNAAGANFHLQAGSLAIGLGVNLTSLGIPALNVDITGSIRSPTAAWDVGAYRFTGSEVASPCDVNGDGTTNVADVQLEVNMALGLVGCTNPSGQCTVTQVQRVVNAALGGACVSP